MADSLEFGIPGLRLEPGITLVRSPLAWRSGMNLLKTHPKFVLGGMALDNLHYLSPDYLSPDEF